MNGKVLIVEDELSIQRILEFEIKQAEFDVELASDGEAGFEVAKTGAYDVIILDVMLPKKDGFSVCRGLRELGIHSHIIMLSARDDEFDRVLGLDNGADDYMTKPFSAREVVSKIKAILRRKASSGLQGNGTRIGDQNKLVYKDLVIDLNKFEVKAVGNLLEFTLKEYELLKFMVQHKGRVLSRDLMLDELWGTSFYGETRVVDVHVFKLRDKLKPYNILIKTVRGVGYLLEDDDA